MIPFLLQIVRIYVSYPFLTMTLRLHVVTAGCAALCQNGIYN